jgi:hypothetical protein
VSHHDSERREGGSGERVMQLVHCVRVCTVCVHCVCALCVCTVCVTYALCVASCSRVGELPASRRVGILRAAGAAILGGSSSSSPTAHGVSPVSRERERARPADVVVRACVCVCDYGVTYV